MNTDFDFFDSEDDVTQYLPVLKREASPKEQHILDEFEIDSSWFETFTNEVKNDVDPRKLHELIVDHLICSGYHDVARILCEDANLDFPPTSSNSVDGIVVDASTAANAETLEPRDAIRDAIVAGDIERAFALINQLTPGLLDSDSRLRFNLLRQQIVELIRNKDIDKVLAFAQENIMDKCEQPPEQFTRLEQTFALLAFDKPEQSPFGHLMSIAQRNILAHEVNEAILAHLKLCPTSKLESLLRMIVFNHNLAHKGFTGGGLTDGPFTHEKTMRLSRELFATTGDEAGDATL